MKLKTIDGKKCFPEGMRLTSLFLGLTELLGTKLNYS